MKKMNREMTGRTGKQKYASMAVLAGAAVFCLGGCADGTVEVKTDAFSIELGEKVSDRPQDYVAASDESMYEEMSVDLSGVDETRAGSYEITVSYQEEQYAVPFEIKDTTPPEIGAAGYLVSQGEVHAKDLITEASDLSGYALYLVSAEKEAELEDAITGKQELETLRAETGKEQGFDAADLTDSMTLEEGAYLVTCAAADEYGNAALAQVHVYIDQTAPEIHAEDQEVTIDASGFATEADTLDAVMEELHVLAGNLEEKLEADVTDNFLADAADLACTIGKGEASLEGKNVTETMKVMYRITDEAGNTAEKEITLTVVYEGAESRTVGIQTGLIEEEQPQKAASGNGTSSGTKSGTQNPSSAQKEGSSTASASSEEVHEMDSWEDNWWEKYMADPEEAQVEEPEPEPEPETYAGYQAEWEQNIFNLINQERAAAGLNQLVWNGKLEALADERAVEISTNFSHTRLDGTSVSNYNLDEGYYYPAQAEVLGDNLWCGKNGHTLGENICRGGSDDGTLGQNIHESFRNSKGHYGAYMDADSTDCAVSVYFTSDGGIYCVEVFE